MSQSEIAVHEGSHVHYKEIAHSYRQRFIDIEWQVRALVKGYDRMSYLGFLRARGFRYKILPVNDYRMKLDLNDNVITPTLFSESHWEPYESSLMSKLLRRGMTFVDVGAHVGYYSLLAAQVVGPTGLVVSFEPSPDNFALLTENVRLNGFSKTILTEHAALGAECGEANLYLSSYNTGDHRMYSTLPDDDNTFNAGARRRSVQVSVASLDEYLSRRGISQVDMIKIDVQGAEMDVLKGMKGTLLHKPQPILFTEFWPHGLLRFGTEPQTVLDFLTEEIGLSLFQILPNGQRVRRIVPTSFASQTRDIDPLTQIDLLGCVPTPGLMEMISS